MPTDVTQSLPGRAPPPEDGPRVEPGEGMRLGRYELVHRMGSGGMAQVWVARQSGDLGFRRLVALKLIRPDHAASGSFRRMFLDEARIASRIHHANVVEVLDLGEDGPIVFQAMALVEGDSVAGLLRRQQAREGGPGLPVPVALRIVIDALTGLHAAHELTDEDGVPMGIVHRDVSPQNILVGLDGVAKIADFGVAKAIGRLAEETEAGQLKGKFAYLSPEQVERQPPDRRSDVFAAGIVLWEALTGERLFRGEDALESLALVRSRPVPDPRKHVDGLAPEVAVATLRALEREPARRFATAAQMADTLEEAARAAGLLASAKAVGSLVTELAGRDVECMREAVSAVCRSGRLGAAPGEVAAVARRAAEAMDPTETAGGVSVRGAKRPRAVLAAVVALAASVAVAGSIAVARTFASRDSRVAGPAASLGSAVSVASVLASGTAPFPGAAASVSSGAVEPAASGRHAPASGADSTHGSPRPPAASRDTARTGASPAASPAAPPKPRFGNPYGP
jgi:serine/threonine-protein kinase